MLFLGSVSQSATTRAWHKPQTVPPETFTDSKVSCLDLQRQNLLLYKINERCLVMLSVNFEHHEVALFSSTACNLTAQLDYRVRS